MPRQCLVCSKTNPVEARYCYYDGSSLSKESPAGPLQAGSLPFPMPFCFADGQSCANFNQLALACQERWEEARKLLVDGVWPTFFMSIGRLDLSVAAKQAAQEADLDVGLSHLLEKFPANPDALRPPKLAVQSGEINLGELIPGKDKTFELVILNQGMFVLRGMVMTNCDWLVFGNRGGPTHKMFQTRTICTIAVRVLGHKLRAGRKPLVGEIVVDTNGGVLTVPVQVQVPIQPFPKGVYANDALAGATSPHDIAIKAKTHPREAALLFEQGAVQAWYNTNGWTYPIDGPSGTGVGAVEHFFEALGLVKPPRLEISTRGLTFKGTVGQRFTGNVTISTQEAKPVYAHAWSNKDWVKVGPSTTQRNTVSIPLEIVIPSRPGETIQAVVSVQGNGKQRFNLPVNVTAAAAVLADDHPDEDTQPPGKRSLGWVLAACGLMVLMAIGLIMLIVNAHKEEETSPIPGPFVKPALPSEPPEKGAWWDGLPHSASLLPSSVQELKDCFPQEHALFDSLATKQEKQRFQAYQDLTKKLADLVRHPKAPAPLSRFIEDLFAFEPVEENVTTLHTWLINQVPGEGVAFRTGDQGEDLERAFWSLQVGIRAVTHKAIKADRAKQMAQDLEKTLAIDIDPKDPPAQLRNQVEKLLAVRCYRNLVVTAAKSVEQALFVRSWLTEKVPEYLSTTFREKTDLDLLAVGLAKEKEAWPKLEPILRLGLQSQETSIQQKVVELYEQADPALAQKMEGVLAAKWKVAADSKLAQEDKVAAIREEMRGPSKSGNRYRDRLEQLHKLTKNTLATAKAPGKQPLAVLQDTLRYSHAATMACALFHKKQSLKRFDDLLPAVPQIDQGEQNKTPAKGDKPKQQGIAVGAQPTRIKGKLTAADERDPVRSGCFRKVHLVALKAGQTYTIDLVSGGFDAFLRVEDPQGDTLAQDDNGGTGLNARVEVTARAEGDFRIIATTSVPGAAGSYTLQVQQGGGSGGPGFGMPKLGIPPGRIPLHILRRKFFLPPPGPPIIVGGQVLNPAPAPQTPKANAANNLLNESDLLALKDKKAEARLAAFKRIAEKCPADLPPHQAQPLAKYLLSITPKTEEIEEVSAHLGPLAKCRHLVLALADHIAKEAVAPQTAENIIGAVLEQPLQFASNEDWGLACQKKLLHHALDLTAAKKNGADEAADLLCALYKEQGMAFGLETPDFLALTPPSLVLESLVRHLASKASKLSLSQEDKTYLEQMGRHLQVAQDLAENDLERLVLLQRIWLKVLALYLQQQSPLLATDLRRIPLELADYDRRSPGVLDQLRAGEEKILKLWVVVHNLQ